jgi:hypothetical protein
MANLAKNGIMCMQPTSRLGSLSDLAPPTRCEAPVGLPLRRPKQSIYWSETALARSTCQVSTKLDLIRGAGQRSSSAVPQAPNRRSVAYKESQLLACFCEQWGT